MSTEALTESFVAQMKHQQRDWVFTFGSFLASVASIGFYKAYANILIIFMEHFSVNRQEAMMPFTIMEFVTCIMCPFVSHLLRYVPPKMLLLCSGLLISLGCGSVGVMPRFGAITWVSFFAIGLGMGAPFVLLTTLVDAKFRKGRQSFRVLATGIIASGTSLGSILGTGLISYAYPAGGFHVTFFLLGSGVFITYGTGLLIMHLADTPSGEDTEASQSKKEEVVSFLERIKMNILAFFEVFKYPLFYLLSLSYLAYGTAAYIFLTTAEDYGRDLRLNSFPRADTLYLSLELLGKLWWGVPFKIFNLPAPAGMGAGLLSLGALLMTVALVTEEWIQKTCAALLGFVGCVPYLLMPLLLADLLGPALQVAGLGWSRCLLGISSIVRTWLVGSVQFGLMMAVIATHILDFTIDLIQTHRAKGLKKMLMLEKIEERKTCTMSWLERVKKATRRSLEDLQVMVTNRTNWRIFVHIVAKSQTGLEGH
ncbi:hypothetical protein LAZ67_4002192 [Cordylochernes scorpioides]|uniref:Major facilitator superfamily (MFS) profile domain-containing protein n=1 Tax=Cordylochernes scorpioides TaxID=51811 RepID=A0ABY6KFL4_9ARAC|nr:hypothetical protein LAZ67_4002192 [Cordylochernes scorpioides]